MDISDSIAMASMAMSAEKLQMNVGISMAKKAMETQETAAEELLDMLPTPGLGDIIDVRA